MSWGQFLTRLHQLWAGFSRALVRSAKVGAYATGMILEEACCDPEDLGALDCFPKAQILGAQLGVRHRTVARGRDLVAAASHAVEYQAVEVACSAAGSYSVMNISWDISSIRLHGSHEQILSLIPGVLVSVLRTVQPGEQTTSGDKKKESKAELHCACMELPPFVGD